MKFIADFHTHSKYSRATAKNLDLENLHIAAQIKGITVIGSADFTHPAWWEQINTKLVPAEEGLFALKPEIARACDTRVPPSCRRPVRFMLVTEISNIYKKNEHTRKNHNLVFMPSLEEAGQFNRKLDKIGNIRSDGRPILGLDARNLLEQVLETSADGYLVPAHVWTPWFSLLGSKSGFDSVEACFEDLSGHIFALETGLSSDPPMNWRVSDLDRFTLISNSDAHSPAKLGREANLFDVELNFSAIRNAMETADPKHFLGTLEFFPEEGKYHVDGHRKCNFRCLPAETNKLRNLCPVCGKPLVLGVLYRVEELADRPDGARSPKARPYESLIPLDEVLSEVFQTAPKTKRVMQAYDKLVQRYGAEFDILRHVPRESLDQSGYALLGEAIERMRDGNVIFDPGYDGEFGRVRIFAPEERDALKGQRSLFDVFKHDPSEKRVNALHASATEPAPAAGHKTPQVARSEDRTLNLNAEQQCVVDHPGGALLIVAGPGTGKTRTITSRITALILERHVPADNILAVTFTNKAALEMRRRLTGAVEASTALPTIATFHGLCRQLLHEHEKNEQHRFTIVDEDGRNAVMADALDRIKPAGEAKQVSVAAAVDFIVQAKQLVLGPRDDLSSLSSPAVDPSYMAAVYEAYQALLQWQHMLDFEDLIVQTVRLLQADEPWRQQLQKRFGHVFVDEFQDINFGQYQLIRLLAPVDANICVIGDPDQAIYGFRGSDVQYFERFTKAYGNVRVLQLTRNYRSTDTILEASFQVIQKHQFHFQGGAQRRTYSQIQGEKTISLLEAPSAQAEAVAIGQTIEQMVGGTGFHAIDFGKVSDRDKERTFSDFAILFRTTDQGRLVAEVLRQAGIPCQLAVKQQFQEQRGTAKLLALLRVMADQGNYIDLNRLTDLTMPGISRETLGGFKTWAYANQMPLSQAMREALRLPIAGISSARQQRLTALIRFINALKNEAEGRPVTDTISRCVTQTTLFKQIPEQDLQTLLAFGAQYGNDLDAFLADQALQRDTDLYRPDVEKVALMTMHAAKGLEFNIVFVAGCEDGLIPYRRPAVRTSDVIEERRLFFVALSRAKEQLFLSWARKRTVFGKNQNQTLSPFVADIEQRLKTNIESLRKKPVQQQLSLF